MEDQITATMLNNTRERAHLFLKLLCNMVASFFGADYKVVLVLCRDNRLDSLMMLSDIDEIETVRAILNRVVDPEEQKKMIDASDITKEH